MSQKALLIPSLLAGLAMFFGIAALAGELPKEGTYSAAYAGYGTCQITAVGKERLLSVCDENALMTTDGFLDHTTWHCWAFADFVKGMGAPHGTCVGTDPAGDQIVGDFLHEMHTIDDKSPRASFKFTGGTGKYDGITGGWTYVNDYNAFRTAVPGTYASHVVKFQGSYKLP